MSRKLRVPKLRTERHLSDFDIPEQLCFLASWFPPREDRPQDRGRWQTWTDFLDDYESIRDELQAHFPHNTDPFAERVRRFVERYGLEELETLRSYEDLCQALEDDADDEPDGVA
jgi:hypothetical protein